MNGTRKVSWILTILMSFILINQVTAQAGPPGNPPGQPDSLFNRVNLDSLIPYMDDKTQNVLKTIQNKTYNKSIVPVHVNQIMNHLLRKPSIDLKIPGYSSPLTFKQHNIIWNDSTRYTWKGITEDSLYRLKMVVSNNKLTGTFMTDTASYRIRPIGSVLPAGPDNKINLHVLTRMDPSGLNLVDSMRQGNLNNKNLEDDSPEVNTKKRKTAEEKTNQGIMVLYSDNVAEQVADPEALVQSAVDDANSAYENSGVSVNLSLVHADEIDYDESSNTDTDLTRLQDSTDGYIDQIHQLRVDYGADIVVLLTSSTQSDENGTVTGEAYEVMADSSTAFAVVRYDFAESPVYTLAHEVGHLQGADHNPQDEVNPYKSYGHGYTYEEGGWRTIMAYDVNACCSRIEFLSTPDVTYNGDPLGTSNESDNARLISETAPTVADFLPPYPLEAGISGPSYVRDGQEGEWDAEVSGGQTPYSYTWYRRYSDDDAWSQVSQQQTYSQVVRDNFSLKLEASDASGNTRETVFSVYTSVKSSIPGQAEHPAEYKLDTNYPNPFNPSTEVNYELPVSSHVKIDVYTVTGQKVRTLIDRFQNGGRHNVTFNAQTLSSGLYILQMKAESSNSDRIFMRSIKMTLMK